MKLRLIFFILFTSILGQSVLAQQGFGTASPNANAVIDLTSSSKGLLLPRLSLTSISSFAPLSAHVAGMVVYNIATSDPAIITTVTDRVSPGYYFNNGSNWVRVLSSNDKAWYDAATLSGAISNTQDIYQLGKVGIGTTSPLSALHLKETGTSDPLVVQTILPKVTNDKYKLLVINNTTGLVSYTKVPPPKSFILVATSGTQNFTITAFGSASSAANADQLTLSATDILVSSDFATLGSNVVTITKTGDYDLTSYCNLRMPEVNTVTPNYSSTASNKFMNVSFAIQTRTGAGAWTTIASSTNTINNLSFNLTFTLKPAITVQHFTANDQIRLIVYRGGGISLTSGTPTTGALGTGIIQNKLLKITRYN